MIGRAPDWLGPARDPRMTALGESLGRSFAKILAEARERDEARARLYEAGWRFTHWTWQEWADRTQPRRRSAVCREWRIVDLTIAFGVGLGDVQRKDG